MPNAIQTNAERRQQIRDAIERGRAALAGQEAVVLPETVKSLSKSDYSRAKTTLFRSLRNQ